LKEPPAGRLFSGAGAGPCAAPVRSSGQSLGPPAYAAQTGPPV